MGRIICPECEAGFDLRSKQSRAGTLFSCPECGTELEVVSENPLTVDYIRGGGCEERFEGQERAQA